MREKLNNTALKKISPSQKPFEILDTEIKGFLLRVQPTGLKTYYFSYRNQEGKKTRIKIGTTGSMSISQARDKALSHAGKVSDGQDVQEEKKDIKVQARKRKENTLSKFIENSYKPWVLANRKSGKYSLSTLKRNFAQWDDYQMSEITVQMVEEWRTEKIKTKLQPSSINRDMFALKGVLSKAVEWDVLEVHPLAKLKPLKVDNSPKVRYLTSLEEQRLLSALRARDHEIKAARDRGNEFRKVRSYDPLPSLMDLTFAEHLEPMIILSLKTGMRRGELFDILWSDVDFEASTITIRAAISKSNQTRHIPLSPTALETITAWKEQKDEVKDHERVFTNSKGERFDNTNKAWRAILVDAKIEKFRWHDMRHDFASKLVMKGAPLNTVRELCGHTDMNTTLRYAHLAPEHKAEAVALLG